MGSDDFQSRVRHADKVLLLSLAAGFPGIVIALFFTWTCNLSRPLAIATTVLLAGAWLACGWAARVRVVRPLQTLANLLLAIREEDFSIRAHVPRRDDPLGEVLYELNELSETLRSQRLGALEATALLRTIMGEISVAVFAFDPEQRLELVNRAGEELLGRPSEQLIGRTVGELGLADCLSGEPVRTIHAGFGGSMGRWGMRRNSFRQHGQPHKLLVLADLSQTLREEERQAWQRLLRVLGHELNNSLAPIRSLSGSLAQLLARGTGASPPLFPAHDPEKSAGLTPLAFA